MRISLVGICVIALTAASQGCSRSFYRDRADREADTLIADKGSDPRWDLRTFRLEPDPRSRFFDPHTPDKPPMPPDDPAADVLAPRPQKPDQVLPEPVEGTGFMELIPNWEPADPPGAAVKQAGFESPTLIAPGGTSVGNSTQRPGQRDPVDVPHTRQGALNADNVYQLALINSRDFQDRKESLFLASLDVTLERFAFAPQLFVTEQAVYERLGRDLPGGDRDTGKPFHITAGPGDKGNVVQPGRSSNSRATDGQSVGRFDGRGSLTGSGLGVGKLFVTGGALLVRFANDTVWELSGPFRGERSQSSIGLDVVQPLLRGGGRAVTLEPLTQTERNLLYEVRSYARFQREFYVSVMTGANLNQGARLAEAQRADQQDSRRRRQLGLLPLIEQLQVLRNEEQNLALLEDYERRFAAFERAGEVSSIQLARIRQDVTQARSRVLRTRRRYFDNLDRFKLQLGVPTDLSLVIDPGLLQSFVLDPAKCELPNLPEKLAAVPYEPDEAVRTAVENRLDLMNARGLLVDHWRKIAVSANGLLGVLSLEYQGTWSTPDPKVTVTSQPLDFSVRRSQHRIGLKTELPLVRKEERNTYRATLIEYQQARRKLMEAEDTVRLEVRGDLREVYRAQEEFDIQRNAVILACRRVDQATRMLQLPPPPGARRELGINAARDLLDAQKDLVNSRNDLVSAWVDYQSAYLELLRDLELLDANDPQVLTHAIFRPAAAEAKPASYIAESVPAGPPDRPHSGGWRAVTARRVGSTELEPPRQLQ